MNGGRGIVGIVAALALWFVAPAHAASWTVLPSPGDGLLNAVSCTSPTACIAVGLIGSYPEGSGSILAEGWNGSRWSVQPEVAPRWRGQSEWTAVSCAGPRFCIATGLVVFASSFTGRVRAIIGIWRGARWSVSWAADGGPLAPVSFADTLGLVSCVSSRFCVAGGWGLASRRPAGSAPSARRWDGKSWSMMPTARGVPAPESVSCASPHACLGIAGSAFERWDGSRWSRAGRMPAVPGFASVVWGGLACRSTTSCIDVGEAFPYGDGSTASVVAESNGRAWTLNVPDESLEYSFVNWGPSSCAPAVGCLILGHNAGLQGGPPLPANPAALWTGTQWTTPPAPSPTVIYPIAAMQFHGVSCAARTCIAVGSAGSRTLIERYA